MRKTNLRICSLVLVIVVTIVVIIFFETAVVPNHPIQNLIDKTTQQGIVAIAQSSLSTPQINTAITEKNKDVANPTQSSRWAYVTLISGIDKSRKYRGFLYNAIIMRKALKSFGSNADFVALIGYKNGDPSPFIDDINMLKSHGIIVHELDRFVDDQHHQLSFAEMALLKVTPYSFTQYEKVQFFDGDVMPTRNMDCYFQLPYNTFTIGAASPLNSGWFMAIPDMEIYKFFVDKAKWRLARDWDKENGWGTKMPQGLVYRGGRPVPNWDFNGCDMDQGLFAHYFVVTKGGGVLIDTDRRTVQYYEKGLVNAIPKTLDIEQYINSCDGKIPTSAFAHFTGQSKPWLLTKKTKKTKEWLKWMSYLDELQLPNVNSTNIFEQGFGSPLGYFNHNFPKGGFKVKESA